MKIELTEKNVKDFEFFNTTKDLNLKDGSKIQKGTEFILESFKENGPFEVHFCINDNNYYAKENGDGYSFSVNEIKEFAEPTDYAISKYEANKLIKDSLIEDDILNYFDKQEIPIELRQDAEFVSLVIDKLYLDNKIVNLKDSQVDFLHGASPDEISEFKHQSAEEKNIQLHEHNNEINKEYSKYENSLKELQKVDNEIKNMINNNFISKEKKHDINVITQESHNNKDNNKFPGSEMKLNTIKPKGLLNKLNITNEKTLNRVEKIIVGVNNIKLKFRPIRGNFDFKHLNDINKFLYGSIYELPRISKEKIMECKNILNDLNIDRSLRVNTIDEFADKTVKHIGKLYNANIFEKGGTNTLKEFTRNLGLEKGFNIDLSKVSNKNFEIACNKCNDGIFNILTNLIKDNTLNIEPSKDMMKIFEKTIERGR